MRLINADSVVAELKDQHDYIMQDPEVSKTMAWCEAVCFNRTIEVLDSTPTFVVAPEWISVEDRLPMEYTDVLVCLEDGRVHIGYRFNSCEFPGVYWDFCSTRRRVSLPKVPFGGAVTHWMPLPEPPKEG